MEFIDIILYVSYLLVFLAALGAIVLPLVNALGNPKTLVKSVSGIVALGVIFLIAWAISGNEVTPLYTKFGITSASSQVIGGVLITTYILLGISIVSILYSELSKLFR
ncbi:MAG: hypothetical protein EX285_09245 [Thaumarchaeota archaeon]|nr:hypothetical protein [Nitrososphaerota archaeon]